MNDWPAALSPHWYALALSREVGRRPLARTLFDRPIALLRFPDGQVSAFEDRCPHRQAPLSSGRLCEGMLQCPYHGWRFDGAGRLGGIPGLPASRPLPAVRARVFPVREHDGIVWVCAQADGAPALPRAACMGHPEHRRFLWSTRWNARLLDALENVLDPTHTHYVHSGLVRRQQPSRRRMHARLHTLDDGFRVDYSGGSDQSGAIYRLFESERTIERAHFSLPSNVQLEYGYRNGASVLIGLHFTPESADSVRLHVTSHIDGRWAPAWAVRLLAWPFLRRVAMQDARMLALQSRNRARFSEARDAIGPLDIVRRQLQALLHGDRGGEGPVEFDIEL